MKRILLAGLLCVLPALKADTISGFVVFSNFSIDAQYHVTAIGNGVSTQGFLDSSNAEVNQNSWTSTYQTSFLVPLNSLPSNATITGAGLNLSYLFGSVLAFAAPSVSYVDQGSFRHGTGTYAPTFSAADPLQVVFSISNGTTTQIIADLANPVNLLTNFSSDVMNGNDLTINIAVSETFNRLTSANGTNSVWKNTLATYAMNRTVQNPRFEANGTVDYTTPQEPPTDETPEPLTLPLSGAGLVAFAFVIKRRKRATA